MYVFIFGEQVKLIACNTLQLHAKVKPQSNTLEIENEVLLQMNNNGKVIRMACSCKYFDEFGVPCSDMIAAAGQLKATYERFRSCFTLTERKWFDSMWWSETYLDQYNFVPVALRVPEEGYLRHNTVPPPMSAKVGAKRIEKGFKDRKKKKQKKKNR